MKNGRKILIVPAAVFLLILFFNEPASIGIPCPLFRYTGLYCSGCGMTRALYRLLHLDFRGSFSANPMLLPFFSIVLFFCIRRVPLKIRFSAGILFLIVYFVFAVLRNIPSFSFLQPV